MKTVAAIDMGTNSFLCLIAQVDNGRIIKTVSDQTEIVRLGEGVQKSKMFAATALQRAESCLTSFKKKIDSYGITQVAAAATSAARDVSNKQELFDIGKRLSIPIQIIEGKKEAELTFKGVQSNVAFGDDIAVVDVGGGSTEINCLQNGKLQGVSLNIGGVRLTEMFVKSNPIPKSEVEEIRRYARDQLCTVRPLENKKIVAVAGTPTTLVALIKGIEYTADEIEGAQVSVKELEEWLYKLASLPLEQRAKLKGLEPKRADIIVAGLAVLIETVRALGGSEMFVSTRGVRYGLAAEL